MIKTTTKTPITGHYDGTVLDLIEPFRKYSPQTFDRALRLAQFYLKYDRKFVVRADIAWAQMIHETGYLQFKGDAKPEWNNFCGLGITGPGAFQTFTTEDLGVLAQYVHLCWYVYPDHVNTLCGRTYDPRHFESAGKHHPKYNGDTSILRLGGAWAVPGIDYADRLVNYVNIINKTNSAELEGVEPLAASKFILQVGSKGGDVIKLQKFLIASGYNLKADGDFGPITATKVKEYQKSNGLPETGVVDDSLKAIMNDFTIEVGNIPIKDSSKYDVVVQLGHVGITKGMTGTAGEREWTKKVGDAMKPLLDVTGLNYKIINGVKPLATDPVINCKVFFALHCDGSTDPKAHGYTLGFKPKTNEAFKNVLSDSYGKLTGFFKRMENSTTGLTLYYMWTCKKEYKGSLYTVPPINADYYALLEHGFFTNPIERKWLEGNIDKIAKHHTDLLVKFLKG